MKNAAKRNRLCLVLCLAMLGSFSAVHADGQADVRSRLKTLQSNLNLMLANHQLTTDQYNVVSERVRQLRLQLHVDSEEKEPMTKEDRSTDFQLIRQISEQASQWAVANSSDVPVSQNASLSDLQSQYTSLNNQYQSLDARYLSAVSARDLQTSQAIKPQLDVLRQQMEDVRSEMQQQISSEANP